MAELDEIGVVDGIPTSGTGEVPTLAVVRDSVDAVLAKLSADPATQTTLAAILAKIIAAPATEATLADLLDAALTPGVVGALSADVLSTHEPVVSAATLSAVASAATSAQLLAANASRLGVIIENTDANDLIIKYGTTASASSRTARIPGNGGQWEMPAPIYTGRIDGIWTADGTGSAYITEL